MRRVLIWCLVAAAVSPAAGCQKSPKPAAGTTPGGGAAGGSSAGGATSGDDEVMRQYLKLRNEYADLLEKKASEAQIRDVSARSGAKLREMQTLPQDRQMALQKKYQKEWDAAKERVERAMGGGKP